MELQKCVDVSACVYSGGWCGIQQSGGGTGSDHVLVGRVGQVDSVHAHVWRRSDDTGETLPQTEVGLSEHTHARTHAHKTLKSQACLPTRHPNACAVISFMYYSSKCLSFTSRKKVVAGKDNMTCTGTAKKYHLCNTKVSHRLPVNFSSLCLTSLLKQTPSR